MARPRDKTKRRERIYPSAHAYGYAYPHGNRRVIYLRLPDGTRRATPLVWCRENFEPARTMLNAAVADYYRNGKVGRAVAVARIVAPTNGDALVEVMRVGDFAREFAEQALRDAPPHTHEEHRAARHHYLESDLPMEAPAIESMLLEKNAASKLMASTRRQYLSRLKAMFAWAVARGLLDRNPTDVVPKPIGRSPKIPGFTREEVLVIARWFAERSRDPDRYQDGNVRVPWRAFEIATHLQIIAGMRSVEVFRMRREDIQSDHFVIRGKGGRLRTFPLVIPKEYRHMTDAVTTARRRWVKEIRGLVDELAAAADAEGRELLMPRTDKGNYRDYITAAKESAAIPKDRRNSHSFRKFALWYWRESLLLDDGIRNELAGHTKNVAKAHYDNARTPEEAGRAIMLSRL